MSDKQNSSREPDENVKLHIEHDLLVSLEVIGDIYCAPERYCGWHIYKSIKICFINQ